MSKVPKLRFKEFSGEWEEKIVGDIGKVSMCKRILKEQTSPIGDIPFYKIGTFGQAPDAYISEKIFEEFKTKYSFPKQGDILISAAGTIGRTVVYDGFPAYFQDSNIVWIDNNEELVFNDFLLYCYENTRWNTENTTIARLYNENLRNISLVIPSKQEQQKIASFLSAIDTKIDQLTRKKELLEQYKKGVMQKIFSQELRFKADDGSDFPDWEEKKLADFLILTLREIPTPKDNYLSIGVRSHGKGTFQKPDSDPKKISMDKLYQVHENDLIVSITFAWEGAIAIVKKEDENGLVSHRFPTYLFNEKLATHKFFKYVITQKSFRLMLELISPGGAGRNRVMSKKDFLNLTWLIPSLEEQTKIASFLSAIDTKIDVVVQQLDKAKNFKKGLLQQMFV